MELLLQIRQALHASLKSFHNYIQPIELV